MRAPDTLVMSVSNMSCASCAGRVDKALWQLPGVLAVDVNLATETVQVTYTPGLASRADFIAASTAAGYAAQEHSEDSHGQVQARKQQLAEAYGRRSRLAVFLAAPVIILGMGGHILPGFERLIADVIGQKANWIIQCIFATAVLFGPGLDFYRRGFPALWRGAPDMNSLVALGTGAAYAFSLIATFLPQVLPEGVSGVYYEPASLIVVLILFGRDLENRAKGRTGKAIQSLLGLRVKTAQVRRAGEFVECPIEEIVVGDVLSLRPGERVAVDGVVHEGSSYIDESMITGEPRPVEKSTGAALTAGTVNGMGHVIYEARRVGHDTTLSQIIQLVEQAQGAKLPIKALVDRLTLWFVPMVLILAFVTVTVWMIWGPAPALPYALVAGVCVLIIACPCAMGLATPTSIMVGTGRAAEMGVLFRKGDALQLLADVDVIAFDKTGTLTRGQPVLTDLDVADGLGRRAALQVMASVEQGSDHPIARAIVMAAAEEGLDLLPIQDGQTYAGLGLSAHVAGEEVILGTERFMRERGIDVKGYHGSAEALASQGKSVIFAARAGQVIALAGVSDALKPSTQGAIAQLKAAGITVVMLTGDRRDAALQIAADLGIDQVHAELLPADKSRVLAELKTKARQLAFVGDGINDAPALAAADIGIALGTGTDVAVESADIVLMSGDLLGVVNAIEMSRLTLRNIKQNLFWAFGYNVALIPVAAGALYPAFGMLLSPILAAAAMALSSIFVLANALRLRYVRAAR
ncbi:MAG: heavy metal translocating P-type ATPase [Planktomarina temperata]|jgi:Cu+-exporting ATPase|uniref:heavy metal translocating P-type ATPase n=2 Tax=Paracoccaceae TaxID=31989 RepID=UPI0023126445|nr:heavy metal translocating P-type ATPase [Planktomarina temperata]MDA7455013.1 heavy metal translocating P-type ATPase [Planktomarina temperata]MDA7461243.1 heavy metal translocating P-type ATPase [Planktomarina temperata]MDA8540229.1 heavy metal translocating P-type ATPase [Planktomarina temperata]MDA8830165.1 heavy metal translocating P-type ATPase [Planktomarina temperata]